MILNAFLLLLTGIAASSCQDSKLQERRAYVISEPESLRIEPLMLHPGPRDIMDALHEQVLQRFPTRLHALESWLHSEVHEQEMECRRVILHNLFVDLWNLFYRQGKATNEYDFARQIALHLNDPGPWDPRLGSNYDEFLDQHNLDPSKTRELIKCKANELNDWWLFVYAKQERGYGNDAELNLVDQHPSGSLTPRPMFDLEVYHIRCLMGDLRKNVKILDKILVAVCQALSSLELTKEPDDAKVGRIIMEDERLAYLYEVESVSSDDDDEVVPHGQIVVNNEQDSASDSGSDSDTSNDSESSSEHHDDSDAASEDLDEDAMRERKMLRYLRKY